MWRFGSHLLVGGLLLGCTDDVLVGLDDPVAGSAGAAGAPACVPATCEGALYACGDCFDNDADGLVDSLDPECLGPCDNTEDSLYSGISGASDAPCKQDCYFDRDTGSGNDDCHYSKSCDPVSADPGCPYDPATSVPGAGATCADLDAAQSDACLGLCLPLTPNGCDCFGCCEVPPGSGVSVWLGSTVDGVGSCDLDSLDDPTRCRPCTRVPSCTNPCDACEICVGRTEIVAGCTGQCPSGEAPCGLPGQAACSGDAYCISGCCVTLPQ